MSQFAVYRYPGGRDDVAFLVQVQSGRLDRSRARVVIPLVKTFAYGPPDSALTPYLKVLGQTVYADPLDVATIRLDRLGAPLLVLPETDQDRIIRAMDEMISRA